MGIDREFNNDDASASDGKTTSARRLHLPAILVAGMGVHRVIPNTPPAALPKVSAHRIPDGLEITNVFDLRTWGSGVTTPCKNDRMDLEESRYTRIPPGLTDGLKITKASGLQTRGSSSISTPRRYNSMDLEEAKYAHNPVGPRLPDMKGCCRGNYQQNRMAGPAYAHNTKQAPEALELPPLAVNGVKLSTRSHQKSAKLLPKRKNNRKAEVRPASISIRNDIRIPIFGKAVVLSKRKNTNK